MTPPTPSLLRASLQVLRRAAWAPAAVLVLHQIFIATGWRKRLDFLTHSLGGAAMAVVMWHATRAFATWLGTLTLVGRMLVCLSLVMLVGVGWEFGEQISDKFLHTNIQTSAREVLKDLWADLTGGTIVLLMLGLRQRAQR